MRVSVSSLLITPKAILDYLDISQEVTDRLFSDAANLFSFLVLNKLAKFELFIWDLEMFLQLQSAHQF